MNADLIKQALGQYGIKEFPGLKDNLEILKYFDSLGHEGRKLKDETSWCSAFVGYVAKSAGYEHSDKLTARSWLNAGCEVAEPEIGDVAVLWRESPTSWKGHVGFYVRTDGDLIYILGGNQSNQVCIQAYPKSRLLGYRRLNKHA